MIAITPRQRSPFVLERERKLPREKQTIFFVRSLTLEERADLDDQANGYDPSQGGQVRMRVGTTALLAVRAGLVAWENLKDESGNEVPFITETTPRAVLGGNKVNPPTDATLMWIADEIKELAEEVRQRSRITNDDAKNS